MKIRKTKAEKIVAVIILMALAMFVVFNIGVNVKRVWDCKRDVDKENTLQYVEFVGTVSEANKKWVEKVLQEQVSDEALNFVVNSGGKIVIVYCDGMDIREYLNEAYGFTIPKTKYNTVGTTVPYKDPWGNLWRVDVVVNANALMLGALGHEMGHVYDLSHGVISEQEEFIEKIYNNREVISEKVMSQAVMMRDYYESTPKEYFAELYKRYCKGDFREGYNEEMDTVVEYFDSLELKVIEK